MRQIPNKKMWSGVGAKTILGFHSKETMKFFGLKTKYRRFT